MSDDAQFELTRRKALAGLGTIGAAGALGGGGTAAFFSDEENFRDNQLVAGELDLKLDWEEHYSDWSDDEADAPSNGSLDIRMDLDGANAADYTAFPPGVEAYDGTNSEPLLYVRDEDVAQFMNNTSVEAFPDSDNDGVQDEFDAANACDVLADVGADDSGLDPTGPRTDGDDTRLDNGNGGVAPLINLNDVKPGDFGELTLSFHLCSNPGYVWLNAGNFRAQENGTTEPEAEDDDEEGPDHEDSTDVENAQVELLDAIQTAWWYDDNCNNLTDGGNDDSTEVDVVIVLDESGSMDDQTGKFEAAKDGAKALTDEILSNSGTQVGLVSFNSSAYLRQGLTTDAAAVKNQITGLSAGGGTDFSDALDAGREELTGNDVTGQITASGNDRDTAEKVMVFLSNGNSGGPAKNEANSVKNIPADIYAIAYGDANEQALKEIASDPDSEFFFDAPTQSQVKNAFDDIGGKISGDEEIFFQGSLRTALTALTSGDGIPLDGNAGDDFNEINDDPTAETRGCFEPTPAANCIGFSWWLPVDHANEIQTDSVAFDLGFYTEQCRHNDGSGSSSTTTTTTADS